MKILEKWTSSKRLLVCNCAIMSTIYDIYRWIKPNGCTLNLRTFPYRLIECVSLCVCVEQVQSKQKTTLRHAKQSNMIMSGQTRTRTCTVGAFMYMRVCVFVRLSLSGPWPCPCPVLLLQRNSPGCVSVYKCLCVCKYVLLSFLARPFTQWLRQMMQESAN